MFNANEYPKTHRAAEAIERAEVEAAWNREHECKHSGCETPFEDSKPCDDCRERFCANHLYNGMCTRCFALDDAADELLERQAA